MKSEVIFLGTRNILAESHNFKGVFDGHHYVLWSGLEPGFDVQLPR